MRRLGSGSGACAPCGLPAQQQRIVAGCQALLLMYTLFNYATAAMPSGWAWRRALGLAWSAGSVAVLGDAMYMISPACPMAQRMDRVLLQVRAHYAAMQHAGMPAGGQEARHDCFAWVCHAVTRKRAHPPCTLLNQAYRMGR